MKALKIFKVPIEKRIFIIPFDFKRACGARENLDVIYFMRYGLFFLSINYFLNLKLMPKF